MTEEPPEAFQPETGRGAAKGDRLREEDTQGDEKASSDAAIETGKEGER